ncbi:hypothetical protein BD626DRAFT_538515, partial [Schizophyllum amplum]
MREPEVRRASKRAYYERNKARLQQRARERYAERSAHAPTTDAADVHLAAHCKGAKLERRDPERRKASKAAYYERNHEPLKYKRLNIYRKRWMMKHGVDKFMTKFCGRRQAESKEAGVDQAVSNPAPRVSLRARIFPPGQRLDAAEACLDSEGVYEGPELGWSDEDSDHADITDWGDDDAGHEPPPSPPPSPPPPSPNRRTRQASAAPTSASATQGFKRPPIHIGIQRELTGGKATNSTGGTTLRRPNIPFASAPHPREDRLPTRARSASPVKPRPEKGASVAYRVKGKGKGTALISISDDEPDNAWETVAVNARNSVSDDERADRHIDGRHVSDSGDECYIVVAAGVEPEIHSEWAEARDARDQLRESGFVDAKVVYAKDAAARRRSSTSSVQPGKKGRKSAFTAEQQEYLDDFVSGYKGISQGTVKSEDFWPTVFPDYFTRWPLPEPDVDLSNCSTEGERAKALQQKKDDAMTVARQ